MDVKIAFATSDGKNVDTHFGMASAFQIYQLVDGTFTFRNVIVWESRTAAPSYGSCIFLLLNGAFYIIVFFSAKPEIHANRFVCFFLRNFSVHDFFI